MAFIGLRPRVPSSGTRTQLQLREGSMECRSVPWRSSGEVPKAKELESGQRSKLQSASFSPVRGSAWGLYAKVLKSRVHACRHVQLYGGRILRLGVSVVLDEWGMCEPTRSQARRLVVGRSAPPVQGGVLTEA